jgi:hypothetical protein
MEKAKRVWREQCGQEKEAVDPPNSDVGFDNLGIRMPVSRGVKAVSCRSRPAFVCFPGFTDFAHRIHAAV